MEILLYRPRGFHLSIDKNNITGAISRDTKILNTKDKG